MGWKGNLCAGSCVGIFGLIFFGGLACLTLILLVTDHYIGFVETFSAYTITNEKLVLIMGWATFGIYCVGILVMIIIGIAVCFGSDLRVL
jgi:hypothetical protein